MQAARRDFGADAVIHAVRSRREGPFFRRRLIHELLAGPASSLQSIAAAGAELRSAAAVDAAPGAHAPSLRGSMARRAYGAAPSEPMHDLDRRRTQLLAQAMAIRLERDEQARSLAAANERATRLTDRNSAANRADPAAASDSTHAPTAQRFTLVPAGGAGDAAGVNPAARVVVADAPLTMEGIASDMRALRALVERIATARSSGDDRRIAEQYLSTPSPWSDALDQDEVGAPLVGFYATLIGHSMAEDLARRIIEEARSALLPDERMDPELARLAVRSRVAALLPPCESETLDPCGSNGVRRGDRPHVISLVGPTGTGKTTTIAKLAASYALRRGLRVGLITTDTFRIAAVDQLRTYADIVGLPLEVADGEQGLRGACAKFADRDVILIDTAGRGHADCDRVDELARLVRVASPHETHLVLSSTARGETLVAQAESFSRVGVNRVVVAKLDETVGFGVLLGALGRIGRPVSWLTTGQHVPDDIEPARSERLADLVLGGISG